MSDSREDSPDWLRLFQPPSRPVLNLSSDSDSSPANSPKNDAIPDLQRDSDSEKPPPDEEDVKGSKIGNGAASKSLPRKSPRKKTPQKHQKVAKSSIKSYFKNISVKEDEEKSEEELCDIKTASHAPSGSVCTLSSDSESDVAITGHVKDEPVPESEEKKVRSTSVLVDEYKEPVPEPGSKGKSSKKTRRKGDNAQVEIKSVHEEKGLKDELEEVVAVERTSDKHVEHHATSSTLPLMFPEKVQRCKALVECEGDFIDLSGDVGAVGRVIISDIPSGENDMLLDLKGTIYKTTIVPSRTFCVVSVGPSEAKIEAIMNDFIQLKPQSNVYDAETVVEGTLEGFSFDSGDEDDKIPKPDDHQEADAEEKQNDEKAKGKGKAKAKHGKKTAGTPKKGKITGSKQPKKRKPQPTKKRKR